MRIKLNKTNYKHMFNGKGGKMQNTEKNKRKTGDTNWEKTKKYLIFEYYLKGNGLKKKNTSKQNVSLMFG